MNLATVIDIAAATLGLFAAVFFCIGALKIKDATLETIATSMWQKGQTISKELALQKVDFRFGAAFLVFSFLAQVVGKCLPTSSALSIVTDSTLVGAATGVSLPLLFVALIFVPYVRLHARATRRLSEAISRKV